MKKILAMILSLTLVVTLSISGSIAYLTSEDSDVNVMTLGKVEIEQIEKQRVEQTNSGKDELEDFVENKPMYPAVGEIKWAPDGVYQQWPTGGSAQLFDAEKLKNVVDKMVFVENTGKSDAYVRTLFAFELKPETEKSGAAWTVADVEGSKKVHKNHNKVQWKWTWMEEPVVINGQLYAIAEAVYMGNVEDADGNAIHVNGVLPAEKDAKTVTTTRPSLLQVFLDSSLTNEDMEALGDTYEILTLSQAVQAAGFEDAKTALDTAFNEGVALTAAKAAEWFSDIEIEEQEPEQPKNGDDDSVTYEIPADAFEVADSDAMDAAIKNGKTVLKLTGEGPYIIPTSAQGKTLTIAGNGQVIATKTSGSYEGCNYALDGSTVTFMNVTINTDGKTYTGYARCNATYNNCIINGTYTLYGKSEFNYCTLNVSGDNYNIWTWGAPTATFNHCTINSDGKALLVYNTSCDLTVNNCVFYDSDKEDFVKAAIETGADDINTTTYHNITVTNTTVNGYAINTTNCSEVNSTLWANKNGLDHDHLNVIVDGVDVY